MVPVVWADDVPPDESNRLDHEGQHFGFSWRGGTDIALSDFQRRQPPSPVNAPVPNFIAHAAALWVHFFRCKIMFSENYHVRAFEAQHGSWNQSKKIDYRIIPVIFNDAGPAIGKEAFADAWLDGQCTLGRPVDITKTADGAPLISDDHTGLIYRVSHQS